LATRCYNYVVIWTQKIYNKLCGHWQKVKRAYTSKIIRLELDHPYTGMFYRPLQRTWILNFMHAVSAGKQIVVVTYAIYKSSLMAFQVITFTLHHASLDIMVGVQWNQLQISGWYQEFKYKNCYIMNSWWYYIQKL